MGFPRLSKLYLTQWNINMAQSDYNLPSTTAGAARSKINEVFTAVRTNNSGNNAPPNTFPNMWWYENDTNLIKMRNEANNGWQRIGYLDPSDPNMSIIFGTVVRTPTGVEAGRIDTHSIATWQAGTATSARLVSPAQVKAAIDSAVPSDTGFSSSQSWQSPTRSVNTSYTNNSGRMIQVSVTCVGNFNSDTDALDRFTMSYLINGSVTGEVYSSSSSTATPNKKNVTFNVPNGAIYRVNLTGSSSLSSWRELR